MSIERNGNKVNPDLLVSKRINRAANPNDILETIASLSNDEVSTPPNVAVKMLNELEAYYEKENRADPDYIPLFSNPKLTFLDPACKSGIFLKEIARRLFTGLVDAFPDEQKRRNHILRNQLFGIAITELTALASRRTLYGSAHATGKFSYSKMPTDEGNIRYTNWRHVDINKPPKDDLEVIKKEIEQVLSKDKDKKGQTILSIVFSNKDKNPAELEEITHRIRGEGTAGYLENVRSYELRFLMDGKIKFGLGKTVYQTNYITPAQSFLNRNRKNLSEKAIAELERKIRLAEKRMRQVRGEATESHVDYSPAGILEEEQHNYPFCIWAVGDLKKYLQEEFGKMEFDVIIGNPPYQLRDTEETSSATPLYHRFVENAVALKPLYLTMITPSRWLTGGKGLDGFRKRMLQDKNVARLVDYWDAKECFPEVDIPGGVSYFLWDRSHRYDTCEVSTIIEGEVVSKGRRKLSDSDVFVRANQAADILKLVQVKCPDLAQKNFAKQVLPQRPYGLRSNFSDYTKTKNNSFYHLYISGGKEGWVNPKHIQKYKELVGKHKVLLSKADGAAMTANRITGSPFYGEPQSVSTETFLVCGAYESKAEAENCIAYIKTKFFRLMLWTRKQTQNTNSDNFSFIPQLDMKKKWTDEVLYKRFGLSKEQIDFVESSIASIE